jgi:hypothetical protein
MARSTFDLNRVVIGLIFALFGALAYGWYYNNYRILAVQHERIEKFISIGERFTAQDGDRERDERRRADQELCERIRALETYSYGFRDVGKVPLTCEYTSAP